MNRRYVLKVTILIFISNHLKNFNTYFYNASVNVFGFLFSLSNKLGKQERFKNNTPILLEHVLFRLHKEYLLYQLKQPPK